MVPHEAVESAIQPKRSMIDSLNNRHLAADDALTLLLFVEALHDEGL